VFPGHSDNSGRHGPVPHLPPIPASPRRRLVEFASSAIGQQICHRGRTLDVGEREASTMEAKTADIWWVTIWVTAEAIRVFCVALLVQIRPISARMMTMIRMRPRVPPG
jgi:hypothetical protein